MKQNLIFKLVLWVRNWCPLW